MKKRNYTEVLFSNITSSIRLTKGKTDSKAIKIDSKVIKIKTVIGIYPNSHNLLFIK